MNLQQFINQWNGKFVPSRGGILGQCVSLSQAWAEVNGVTGAPVFPVASAYQMGGTRPDFFTWEPNTPTGVPSPGDIVVWGRSWGGGHGHTGLVVSANVNTMDVFQQNDPMGGSATVKRYGYNDCLGWLKLKSKGDVMDTGAGKELYRTGLFREAENDAAAAQWNGRKTADALSVLRTAPEWQQNAQKVKDFDSVVKQRDTYAVQVTELTKKVADLTKQYQDALNKPNEDSKLIDETVGQAKKWWQRISITWGKK